MEHKNKKIWSINTVKGHIDTIIEDALSKAAEKDVWIQGRISKIYATKKRGCILILKDKNNTIKCYLPPKVNQHSPRLKVGQIVEMQANVNYYQKDAHVEFIVNKINTPNKLTKIDSVNGTEAKPFKGNDHTKTKNQRIVNFVIIAAIIIIVVLVGIWFLK